MTADAAHDFAGKVAIVTGGGTGVGFGVARAFARAGAHMAIAGRRKATLTHAAAAIEEASGAPVLVVEADVAVEADCERIVAATLERFGALDILVNNAARFALVPLIEADAAEAARVLTINVAGPLHCARAFAKWAFERGRGGAIVNISSIAGARPAPGCGLYSASKAALDMLTRSMALEWAPKGMRVNAVAPGHVATEGVIEDFRAGRLDEAAMLSRTPARRIADVDDIADAVLFLCSDRARHIMGQVLTVDGGEGFV
ncbi:MAG TPA: glucose 1-dehydrogenase [Roseiarcus sp.]|nr:glucose 1-dehydrogenase [Roseiarcus sp.]